MSSKEFLQEYIGKEPEEAKGIPNFEMNRPVVQDNTLADIGIEIEVEGGNLPTQGFFNAFRTEKSQAVWQVKNDGSLRNGGLEYVLSTPCFREEVDEVINFLWSAFELARTEFRLTNRCSTHVHVNQNGKKINHLTSTLALWTTFEEILINWCGLERKTNHFCLSGKDTNNLIHQWNQYLINGRPNFHDGFKYLALNVRPLWGFGSLEFRPMRADEKKEPVLDWIKFVYGLCKYATERYEDPSLLANDLSERGGRDIFIDICKTSGVSDNFIDEVFSIDENFEFEKQTLVGFRRVQSVVLEHPWGDWLPLINKVYIPSPFGRNKKPNRPAEEEAGIFEAGLGAIEVLRQAEALRRARAVNLPRYRIRPDLPLELTDGTPVIVHPNHRMTRERLLRITSRVSVSPLDEPVQFNLQTGAYYNFDLDTGWFIGESRRAQIRNVGDVSLPEVQAAAVPPAPLGVDVNEDEAED